MISTLRLNGEIFRSLVQGWGSRVRVAARARLWILCVSVLLLGQIGLLLHQAEHHLNPDLMSGDECASCAFSTAMATGDTPVITTAPQINFVIDRLQVTALAAPVLAAAPAFFRSRAPPATDLI